MLTVNGVEHGLIAAGDYHSLAVQPDGTLIGVGDTGYSALDISGWTGIVKATAGFQNTFGLKVDGTCLQTGRVGYIGPVSSWTNLVDIDAYDRTIAGLTAAGTAYCDDYNVTGWTDLVQIAAGDDHVVGLTSTGEVLHAGKTSYSLPDATTWTDIVRISAGDDTTWGIKSDGTVVAVGYEQNGNMTGVSAWTDLVDVVSGRYYTVGLKSDGTLYWATTDSDFNPLPVWSDIIAIAGSDRHVVALKADGTVLAAGSDTYGKVSGVVDWSATTGQYYPISGITSIDGTPTPMTVRAYESDTGAFKIETQSDATGQYTLKLPKWYSAYIMAIPPAGHRPMAHGPITPPPEDTQV